ncbi:MAG: 16S rRNA (guanine(527)-N(7))-methyltransferase RsmG [Thermodesulfobacteriota bacterium]
MIETCAAILRDGLARLGLSLDDAAVAGLCRYHAELAKWSRKMNLIAKAPLAEVIETHFLDSLTLLPVLDELPAGGPLLDIGSGAGFPGLALKIARPALAVTLVEPRQKRVSFLRHVIRTLGLANIEVIEERIEPGQTTLKGEVRSFPIVTSRAFTAIAGFLACTAGLNPPGGAVICMKGRRAEEEIAQWQTLAPESPYTLTKTFETALPFSTIPRRLLLFTKNG